MHLSLFSGPWERGGREVKSQVIKIVYLLIWHVEVLFEVVVCMCQI